MRIAVMALLFTLAARAASAQKPAPPPEKPPVFSSRSELVLIPVVVRNHNQFVSGLKPEQFTILDDGKPRRLSIFEEGTAAQRSAPEAKPLGPHEFSNNVRQAPERPLTIILLDLLNTRFAFRDSARQEIIKFLGDNIDADQPTALLILTTRGIREIHSFTTDTSVLVAALRTIHWGAGGKAEITAGSSTASRTEAGIIVSSFNANEEERIPADLAPAPIFAHDQARNQTFDTLRGFEQIAHAFSGIPGRKALLWVSDGFRFNLNEDPKTAEDYRTPGFPKGPQDDPHFNGAVYFQQNEFTNSGYYDQIWRLLINANIALYAIDPSGLPAGAGGKPRTFYDTLHLFPDATGGQACLNQNDTANCLRKAATDAQSYYMLGFYVPASERKPGWHDLKLKLTAAHSDLRYRKGYFLDSQQAAPDDPRKGSMRVAFQSPLDYTGVPMDIIITGISTEGAKRKVSFALALPPTAFFIDEAGGNHVQLALLASATQENAKKHEPAIEWSKTFTAKLKTTELALLRREGFNYQGELEVTPGKYQLKWVVRDDLTGNMGSVTAPLEVR